MIKRTVLVFLVCLFSTSKISALNLNSYKNEIIQEDSNKNFYIKSNKQSPVGSSGLLMHKFDDIHSMIIARVIIVEKTPQKDKVNIIKFDGLKQESIPNIDIKPKVGDEVIMNYNYRDAIAIVPDLKQYLYITKKYPKINWINPDIFAATLTKNYNPSPNKKDFFEMCDYMNISLIFFGLKDSGYFVDCYSFKPLLKESMPLSNKASKPFYTRVGVEPFAILGTKGIEDYYKYYENMIFK